MSSQNNKQISAKVIVSDKKPKNNRFLKNAIKYLIFTVIAVVSYGVSLYTNGLKSTNNKLITLVICTLFGILLFYLIYCLVYAFTKLSYARKRKRNSIVINCDEELANILNSGNFNFSYDVKKSVNENLKQGANLSYILAKTIASGYGSKTKYVYLDYTVYDALEIIGNALDVVKEKTDSIFSLLHLQDKPISFLEKKLSDILEGQDEIVSDELVETKPTLLNKLKSGIKSGATKLALFTVKGQISKLTNEIIQFIGSEAFRVFSKGNRPYNYEKAMCTLQDIEVLEVKNV